MRKLIVVLSLVSTAAFAEEAPQPPSLPDVTAEANRLIAALSGQRDACMNREAREAAEIERLAREIAAIKTQAEQKEDK